MDAPPRSACRKIPHAATGVVEARHFVDDHLALWGLDGVRSAVALATSEVVTNAITHGRGPIEVRAAYDDGVVRVEVTDAGGGRPHLRAPDPSGGRPGGWGLRMVEELVDAWGTDVAPGRTTVWLELGTDPRQ